MKWLIFIVIITIIIVWSACKISSNCSREEEYKNFDPKVLDDDTKEWNIEEEYPYNETFVKKENKNEKD